MKTSENIGDLFTALAKAQGEFGPVTKEKTGTITDTRKYKYADLAATMDAVTPALSKNGLAFIQPAGTVDDRVIITSMIVHGASGQWVSEEYAVPLFSKAQDQGSAITYGRRYSAWALLGVAPEDDDGKSAQEAPAPEQKKKTKPEPSGPAEETLTKDEQKAVREALLAAARKASGPEATADELASKAKELLRAAAGVEATKDVPRSKLQQVTQFVAGVTEPPADLKTTEPEAPREPGGDDE